MEKLAIDPKELKLRQELKAELKQELKAEILEEIGKDLVITIKAQMMKPEFEALLASNMVGA